jgi:hypothetical protein
MNPPIRSKSPVQAHPSRFPLALTLGTWLAAACVSVWFWFSPYGNLSGLEWLGSPLLGLGMLAVITTVYCLGVGKVALAPTAHVVAWLLFLFLATAANMLTLARFVFGEWMGFLAFPLVVAFDLVLIALGIHFSLKFKSRGFKFQVLTWTIVLLLGVVSSMATLGIALQPGFWTIGLMAELALGVTTGSLMIGYSALTAHPESRKAALAAMGWRHCILLAVSLLAAHIVLSAQVSVWLVSYAAVAFLLTVVVMALQVPTGKRTLAELSM